MDRLINFFLATFVAVFVLSAGTFGQGPDGAAKPKAKPLPAGMKPADTNDPRAKLSAGLFDAGEIAWGMKHVSLAKKPDVFQIGVDPADPKVGKALGSLGIPDPNMVPAAQRMAIAGLAFGNSDLAFLGNYVFMGNFYGMNIYDISNPAEAKLVTSMVCPGGQGDVSVYKNLMFMSVEMPNGRVDCGEQGFKPAADAQPGSPAPASKERFRGVRIFDISDI